MQNYPQPLALKPTSNFNSYSTQPYDVQQPLMSASGPRPSLHARSVTSPSNPTPNQPFFDSTVLVLDPDFAEDPVFSDDERSTMGSATSAHQPSVFEGMVKRARSTTQSIRPPNVGTGPSGADGKEYGQGDLLRGQVPRLRSRSQAPGSPEVPKVPEAFLKRVF